MERLKALDTERRASTDRLAKYPGSYDPANVR